MSIFSNFADKLTNISINKTEVCNEVDEYLSEIEDKLVRYEDFIDVAWAEEVRSDCDFLQKKIADASIMSYIPTTKTYVKKQELQKLIQTIDGRVVSHNDCIAATRVHLVKAAIGCVEGRELDTQQMKCIVKPMRNHLVIAGAGTGKTTTIVGKVKYLLNTNQYKPEDILVLSFTNASAEEMKMRICKETQADIEASTFHKLGINIITKANGITPKITKLNTLRFVEEQIAVNMRNIAYLQLLCAYFMFNHKYAKTEFDFRTQVEYDEYLRLNPPTTLKGDVVKSYGEADIANFLFQNGIEYEYEREYEVDTRTDDRTQYYPDFYLPQYGIYIEYYAVDENGKVPDYFSASENGKDASTEYRESMEWKRKTHKKNNTRLIELYAYEKMNGSLLTHLNEKLVSNGVEYSPLSAEDLWSQVAQKNEKRIIVGLAELMTTIITLIKSNNISYEQFKRECVGIKEAVIIKLVEPIYTAYQDCLKQRDEIDFNDMINMATDLVSQGKYVNPYRVVIVDEYQDISKARYNLLRSLRESSDFALFCVGDDWQSIYRFAGSDMSYILNFSKYWGPTEFSRIETTYRFSDSLIDISGRFVMQNPQQIRKAMRGVPSSIGFALGEIKEYNEQAAIVAMVSQLDSLPANSTVFFIGRYSFDSKLLDDCDALRCSYDNANGRVKVTYSRRSDLSMQFITAHRSKGLQADYVFIINNKHRGMGFPSQIQNDPVVEYLLEGEETYAFAEERRLFYVALTRAKIKSYVVTVAGNESVFISELEQRHRSELWNRPDMCPECGGRLILRTGQYGSFYGCGNYRANGCKYKKKI